MIIVLNNSIRCSLNKSKKKNEKNKKIKIENERKKLHRKGTLKIALLNPWLEVAQWRNVKRVERFFAYVVLHLYRNLYSILYPDMLLSKCNICVPELAIWNLKLLTKCNCGSILKIRAFNYFCFCFLFFNIYWNLN